MTFKEAIKFSPTDSLELWLLQYQDFVALTQAELASRKAHPSLSDPAVPFASRQGPT